MGIIKRIKDHWKKPFIGVPMHRRILYDEGGWKLQNFLQSGGGGLLGWGASKLMGENEDEPGLPPPPDYYEDPYYTGTQKFLSTYGQDILEGRPNAYYGEMGSYGGPEFEKVLGLSNRDIQQSAMEVAAKAGRGRGGFLPSVTAQTVADNSSKLRYADYLKAMEGRQFLMQQGRGITEGVRESGFGNQKFKNTFNLDVYDRNVNRSLFDINRADQAAAQRGEMLSKLFGIGAGAIVGGMTGGPVGALVGAAGGVGSLAQSGALDKIFGMGGAGSKTDTLSSATPGGSG